MALSRVPIDSQDKVKKSYKIRTGKDHVSVSHRESFSRTAIVAIGISLWFFLTLDSARIVACFIFLLLFGVGLLSFTSGQVIHCDARELHLASRKIWKRWHHLRFSSEEVRGLHTAVRGMGEHSYRVLTFQYQGQTIDMLKNISWTDADRVLIACRSLGLDTIIPIDPGAAMIKDIERRGWLLNPLRPDRDENSPQQ